jgi:hypothetical protein
MSFHLFIAISFYHNIVCKNIVCELGLSKTLFFCFLQNLFSQRKSKSKNSQEKRKLDSVRLEFSSQRQEL